MLKDWESHGNAVRDEGSGDGARGESNPLRYGPKACPHYPRRARYRDEKKGSAAGPRVEIQGAQMTNPEDEQARLDKEVKVQGGSDNENGGGPGQDNGRIKSNEYAPRGSAPTTIQRIKRERNLHCNLSIQLRIFQPNVLGSAGASIPHVQVEPVVGGGLFNRVTIGNGFDYVFDGEILTSEATEISFSVIGKLQSGTYFAIMVQAGQGNRSYFSISYPNHKRLGASGSSLGKDMRKLAQK
ncbi:hypothetical protein BGX38DRAFT_1275518 [Terfezia claveryi]|nr:hypothetical protein BGX38DRAFT_1275518 [Terfezia claveryi]